MLFWVEKQKDWLQISCWDYPFVDKKRILMMICSSWWNRRAHRVVQGSERPELTASSCLTSVSFSHLAIYLYAVLRGSNVAQFRLAIGMKAMLSLVWCFFAIGSCSPRSALDSRSTELANHLFTSSIHSSALRPNYFNIIPLRHGTTASRSGRHRDVSRF